MRRVADCLTSIYRVLLVGLAPALYLSYLPVIRLGGDMTMNFELSVAEIWLVVLDVVGVMVLISRGGVLDMVRRWGRQRWMWLFFPVYVTVSAVRSLNAARGWLTAGLMWAVALAVIVIWELRGVMNEVWRRRWWRGFIGGTLVVCGWCVMQCALDIAGVGREVTGMCAGCVSQMFGFPHPNGWAVEPQFMGNLLLAPGIMTAMIIAGGFKVKPSSAILFFIVVAVTIFLTFSRGAIYAFVIGAGVLGVYYIVRWKAWKGVAMVWGVMVVAFAVVLNLQGLMAAMGPTGDTYADGVAKAVNHLSLGVLELRGGEASGAEATGGEEGEANGSLAGTSEVMDGVDSSPSPSEKADEAVFDGYVAESTEIRVRLNDAALAVWASNPAVTIAGVGIGGAGVAMYQAGLTVAPKEIVQNEYISLLLETGVIGVMMAGVMVISMVVMLVQRRAAMVLVLMGVYGVTLLFFSGLPNALQIYIMPVLILAIYSESRKKLVS